MPDIAQAIYKVAPTMSPEVVTVIQSSIQSMWDVLLWGLGACGGGFIVLLGLVIRSLIAANQKASYDWVKDELKQYQLEKVANVEITAMNKRLEIIEKLLHEINRKLK